MTSTTKNNNDHDTRGRGDDIIEGRRDTNTDTGLRGITGASIMYPAPPFKGMYGQRGGVAKASHATGVTGGDERQRSRPHGAPVADETGPRAARDEQRDRSGTNVVEGTSVAETVLNDAEVASKTKDLIACARKMIAQSPPSRASLHDDDHQYARKAELIRISFESSYGTELERWMQSLAPYAPASNSFFLMRAAICWQKRRELKDVLFEVDLLEKDQSSGADVRDLIAQMEAKCNTLNLLQGLQRQAVLEMTGGKSRRKTSLRDELGLLPSGWQDRMVARAQASNTYADAIAVLAITGCRPEELVQGVRVRLDREPAVICIHGAKLSEHSGQPWREIEVASSELPSHLLQCLREERDVAYVTIPSTDALRQALYDMSAELWPSGIRIAPYHFRHSRAETLRASGWAAHEIAAVLGERSARTVAHYGRKTRPGSRTPPRVPIKRDGVRVPIAISPLPAFNPENLSRRFKPKSKLRWPQQMLDRFQEAVKSNICLGSLKEAAEMVPRLQACSCTNIAMLSLG